MSLHGVGSARSFSIWGFYVGATPLRRRPPIIPTFKFRLWTLSIFFKHRLQSSPFHTSSDPCHYGILRLSLRLQLLSVSTAAQDSQLPPDPRCYFGIDALWWQQWEASVTLALWSSLAHLSPCMWLSCFQYWAHAHTHTQSLSETCDFECTNY